MNAETGEPLWRNALLVDHSVGPGSSPVIAGRIVLVVCDGIDQQYVAGLDLETGQQIWKTPRPPIRNGNGEFTLTSVRVLARRAGSPSETQIELSRATADAERNTLATKTRKKFPYRELGGSGGSP